MEDEGDAMRAESEDGECVPQSVKQQGMSPVILSFQCIFDSVLQFYVFQQFQNKLTEIREETKIWE